MVCSLAIINILEFNSFDKTGTYSVFETSLHIAKRAQSSLKCSRSLWTKYSHSHPHTQNWRSKLAKFVHLGEAAIMKELESGCREGLTSLLATLPRIVNKPQHHPTFLSAAEIYSKAAAFYDRFAWEYCDLME